MCYLGDGVLVGEDAEEEVGGGPGLAVGDGTVAVHDQVLLDPGRQVLLPARLHRTHTVTHAPSHTPGAWLLSGSDPAAVVHAAQRGDGLGVGGPGAQADGAGAGGAGLRVPAPEAGGRLQRIGVVGVALHQQVCVPLAVDQEVLGPVQVQAEGRRHLGTRKRVGHHDDAHR